MKFLLAPILLAMVACSSAPGPVIPKTKVERQMIGLLQKFDRWDENGDGQLPVSELTGAQKISGHTPAELLEFYDTDRSGGISLKEAQKGYSRADDAQAEIDTKR